MKKLQHSLILFLVGAITTNTFEVTAFYKPEDLIVDMEDYFA